jgi:anaerobic ribonucleoside-triphosphate reductase
MSIKGNIIDERVPKNIRKFLPKVHTKEGTFIFHPGFIYRSLLRETSISKKDALKITEQTVRFLVAAKLELITAPLIREVVNVHLLKNRFEKERLQYTRIGLPYNDLKDMLGDEGNSEEITTKIINWVVFEFYEVNKLIRDDTKSKSLNSSDL